MKTFTDKTGRQWRLQLNVAVAMAVKAELDIDLLNLDQGDPPLLTRLGLDELLLAKVVAGVIGVDQFTEKNVTPEDLYRAFDGEVILAAQKAFYEELVDFFQSRGKTYMVKAIQKQLRLIEIAATRIESKLDAMDLDQLADDLEAKLDGELSGESPASSA